MAISPRFWLRFLVPLLSCAFASAAWPQIQVARLQLESVQRFNTAQPRSDNTGSCWAWRSEKEILVPSSAPQATRLAGFFLQHELSANGKALLALEKPSTKREHEEKAGLVLRWFDNAGRPLGAHALPWQEDDPLPRIILNRTGSHALVLEPASARATFFEEAARVVNESLLFENAPYTNERPALLAASEEHFYVLSQVAPTTTPQARAPVLVCYAMNGNEQWRRELPRGTAGYLALSPGGTWLVANQYEVTDGRVQAASFIFEAAGQQRATFSGLLREASFSNGEQFLFALDRRALRCVETASGKILWQTHLQPRSEMFAATTALSNKTSCIALVGASVLAQGRFVFQNARLRGFDDAGRQQFELAVAEALAQPRLVVSADRQHVLLAAEGLLQRYRIITPTQRQRE